MLATGGITAGFVLCVVAMARWRGSGVDANASERLDYWRWLYRRRQWWFLRVIPTEYETVLFLGLPGVGKTTFGADHVIRLMRRGVRVYANVYMRDTYTGLEARPVLTWIDVMRASVEALEDGITAVIYLAEINMMCDARDWQKSSRWWTEFMQQRRHMGIGLVGDTQNLAQVEKRLRLLVGRVVQIRPTWLRSVWRRWPVFMARHVDLQLTEDPAQWLPPGRERRVWQYSHAFHGHGSWQLLAGQDFGDLDTPEAQVEIAALRQRALALNEIAHLPAFTDDEEGGST
ncbi:MAG: hypothetical protein Q8N28_03465 [bacterium]|nr:hypothetical protein [bacterium]